VGDRSTGPAQRGTKGHTSGINVVVARASDEINNAQRCGDFAASQRIEDEIAAFEEIRFRDGRMYNYSAVVEAMHLGNFTDVDGGEGGPFNPRVPATVADEVKVALEDIVKYH
jgi:dihydrodipicolinate synthase/N-acetylneuraminate lyase